MAINNPSILSHNAVTLLGSVDSINMESVAATTLYTVPPGKVLVPHFIILRNNTGSYATCAVTFGQSGTKTDFLGTHTLTNITTTGASVILRPIPATTPAAEIIQYTAGEIFQMDVTTGAGQTCVSTVELYGTLDDA